VWRRPRCPEDGAQAFLIDQLQLPHPRRIEEQAAAGEEDELAVGRDVTARSSLARTAPVGIRSSPSSRLTSVDLPAPEEPTSAAVIPSRMRARIGAMPSARSALVTSIGTPAQRLSTSATRPATSSQTSALLRSTAGWAPLAQMRAR